MKNFLFAIAAITISALAITNGANAQNSNNMAVLEHPSNAVKVNKLMLTDALIIGDDEVNMKALKSFRKSYKTVSGVRWVKTTYGFTARFTANDIHNVIYYDMKGNWQASIKTYQEDKFNPTVRAIVKSKYFDYRITQVQEIENTDTNGIPTYIVHIEDEKDFMLVRVSDGNMDVYEQFKKG